LMTQSVTGFVILKSFLGPATTGLTLVIGLMWFRRRMHDAGVDVVVSRQVSTATPPLLLPTPRATPIPVS
jgi:hypothetical protein